MSKGKVSSAQSLVRLKAVVILCGAVLMALEMVGVRILTVYFGSTQYVWGAIIGVFLGALSLGYTLGGSLADRSPRYSILGSIILVAAALVFIVPWLAPPLCQALSSAEGLGPKSRALLSSLLLYFLPSVALGMVSPFAVRLAAHAVEDIGKVAGRLYALSTLGSIVGTFLASFVLVEYFGNRVTIWGLGIALLLTALFAFQAGKRLIPLALLVVLGLPAWYGTTGSDIALHRNYSAPLQEFDSAYHHISVVEGRSYVSEEPSRFLFFNSLTQSGIELKHDQVVTACGYTDMLHIGLPFLSRQPQSLLVVGCGGGVGPQVFYQDYSSLKTIDVVDIDPAVFRMAREYFRYPADGKHPVINSHVVDGRLFIRNSGNTYDYVVLDAYSSGGRVPFHLTTQEFFEETREVLAEDGVLVINLISAAKGDEARLLRATLKTLRTVFPQVYAFPRNYAGGGTRAENIAIVASQKKERLDRVEVRRRLQLMTGTVPKHSSLRQLAGNLIEPITPYPDDPLLTDDFAPTDSMVYR